MSDLKLTLKEIEDVTKGKIFNSKSVSSSFSECVYDSRKVTQNSIFFCIPGERVDGHDFIEQAVKSGASLILGEDEGKLTDASEKFKNTAFCSTKNTLESLQSIAIFYRKKFNIPVLAVTGSAGKTTTKDLASSILGNQALITEGSLNNHWGVPQTVMRLRSEHKVALFELGTSGFGEIYNLAKIAQPNIALITNIGASHLEKLKDTNGVFKAKRELFDWITANNKEHKLLFNLDDPLLKEFYDDSKSSKTCFSFSTKDKSANIVIESFESKKVNNSFGWSYSFKTPWGSFSGELPLPGFHNLTNALCASALCLASETVTSQDVVDGLKKPKISKFRSNVFYLKNGALVYDDSYNANPFSARALFDSAKDMKEHSNSAIEKVIAVVGDMLELGPNANQYHIETGSYAASSGIHHLFTKGEFAEKWAAGFNEVKPGAGFAFEDSEKLFGSLKSEIEKDPKKTLVVVKGSRGAKMEVIVDRLKNST